MMQKEPRYSALDNPPCSGAYSPYAYSYSPAVNASDGYGWSGSYGATDSTGAYEDNAGYVYEEYGADAYGDWQTGQWCS